MTTFRATDTCIHYFDETVDDSRQGIPDFFVRINQCCHTAFDAFSPERAKSKGIHMAQKVNIVLVDDLDGTEAAETVSFGLDGTTYEIDLNDANAASLREALSGYVGHARKVTGGGRRTRRSSGGSSSSSNTKDVREWAKAQGMEVSERGRISADVQQAYDAAH